MRRNEDDERDGLLKKTDLIMLRAEDVMACDMNECNTPGCTADHDLIGLPPECHRKAGSGVRFSKEHKAIVLYCMECGAPYGLIKVEERASLPRSSGAQC